MGLRRLLRLVLGAVCVTILAGAFVAGTRAGLIYNTFPLMDGRIVPADYVTMPSILQNTFENPAAVQFHHRVLAVCTFALVALFWWRTLRERPSRPATNAATALMAAVLVQVATGIVTLLLVVPIPLAAVHQGGSVVVFACALLTAHRFRPEPSSRNAAGTGRDRKHTRMNSS